MLRNALAAAVAAITPLTIGGPASANWQLYDIPGRGSGQGFYTMGLTNEGPLIRLAVECRNNRLVVHLSSDQPVLTGLALSYTMDEGRDGIPGGKTTPEKTIKLGPGKQTSLELNSNDAKAFTQALFSSPKWIHMTLRRFNGQNLLMQFEGGYIPVKILNAVFLCGN